MGQKAVFFTHGMHYGDGLVVRELGNVPAGDPTMEAQVNSAIQAGSDSDVTQRLAQAELVVSGSASAPVPYASTPAAAGSRVSEHDPDWWKSTITVETTEKGTSPGATMDILFPHSMDIAWSRSPKVKAGDRGVWLLQNSDLFGKPVPAHAVVHSLDFRPITELEHVRTLLKGAK